MYKKRATARSSDFFHCSEQKTKKYRKNIRSYQRIHKKRPKRRKAGSRTKVCEMSTAILAQFNKYPFFLFLTYSKEARLDLEKMEVHTVIVDQEYNPDTKRISRIEPLLSIFQRACKKKGKI